MKDKLYHISVVTIKNGVVVEELVHTFTSESYAEDYRERLLCEVEDKPDEYVTMVEETTEEMLKRLGIRK